MNKKILLIAMLSIAHIHTMDVPNDKEKAFTSENLDQIIEHTLPITTQKIQKVIKHEDYLFFLLDDHTIKAYNLETRGSFHINIQVSLPLLEKVFLLKPKIKHISEIFTSNGTLYMPVATDDKVFLAEVRLPKNDNTVITLDINKKIITHNTSICSLHTVMSKIKEKTTNAVFVISSSHYPSMKIWQHTIDQKDLNNAPLNYSGALYSGIHSGTNINPKRLFFFKDGLNQESLNRWLKRNDETFNAKMAFLTSDNIIKFNEKNKNSQTVPNVEFFLDTKANEDQIVEKKTQTFSQCFLQKNALAEGNKLYGGWCNNKNDYILFFRDNIKDENGYSLQIRNISYLSNRTDFLQKNHPKKLLFFYNTVSYQKGDNEILTSSNNELRMIALFENKLMAYKLSIEDNNKATISYGHELTKIGENTYETMIFDEVKKEVYCICKRINFENKILYRIPINKLEYIAEYPDEEPLVNYGPTQEVPYLEYVNLWGTSYLRMYETQKSYLTITTVSDNRSKKPEIDYSRFTLTERKKSEKPTLDNEIFIFDDVDNNIRINVNVSGGSEVATYTIDSINTLAEPNTLPSKKPKK